MLYRAIVFDMGDIFFDATPWRRAITAHLQQQGVAIDYPAFCRRWEDKLVAVYLGRRPYWEAFRELMADLGLTQEKIDAALEFAKKRAAGVEHVLFDGVAETLAKLKARGVKLAVLSDSESSETHVRSRLAKLGIEQYFDAVVTSIDLGHVKPEPEAFAAALDRLNASAAETLFVGHDTDELDGAAQCGLATVAFNDEPAATADRHIGTFLHLLDCLD
jgi:putative hydrolase of the HAD superfamily